MSGGYLYSTPEEFEKVCNHGFTKQQSSNHHGDDHDKYCGGWRFDKYQEDQGQEDYSRIALHLHCNHTFDVLELWGEYWHGFQKNSKGEGSGHWKKLQGKQAEGGEGIELRGKLKLHSNTEGEKVNDYHNSLLLGTLTSGGEWKRVTSPK
eukprot:TRINITY_DN4216_c0_g1_i1.p1 TRINITY_DN4216_c0_g1~~TRINITY_DN4216_c0_g1_i1.p1  ORF type:complete len:150 (-),score=21.21 TRINITY_DN4216_c0_g1_i1:142-591(-)